MNSRFSLALGAAVLGLGAVLPDAPASSPAATRGKRYFRPDGLTDPAYTLPDLLMKGGRRITSADEWVKHRRPEVLELFREHMYGRVPPTPYETQLTVVREDRSAMEGAATLRQVNVRVSARGKQIVIQLSLFIPNHAPKPVPTFLLICNRDPDNIDPTRQKKSEFWPAEEGIARGFGMAAFHNAEAAPDNKNNHFRDGAPGMLDQGVRPPDAWGALAAWAWGASRCLDYLVTDRDVAAGQVAVIGHSRGGKAALWAAAEDERFAMACSNESGCGGAALSRRHNKGKESVARINQSVPHWFNDNFKTYGDRVDELPVDQHMLMALIAPRPVCVGSAEQDLWADPRGEFLSLFHAGPVYRLFGKQGLGARAEMPAIGEPLHGDAAHYHIREGKHNLLLYDWTCYWDFADQTFGRARPGQETR